MRPKRHHILKMTSSMKKKYKTRIFCTHDPIEWSVIAKKIKNNNQVSISILLNQYGNSAFHKDKVNGFNCSKFCYIPSVRVS